MQRKLIKRRRKFASRWRNNFFTGLAILLPIAISIAVFVWLFGTVTKFTDTLLFFVPREYTHAKGEDGPVLWWWSCAAFAWAAILVSLVGRLTRYYIGKKFINAAERIMLAIPILNTIYGAVKQINEAFASDRASAFEQVVMIEFPRQGAWSVGFLTSESHPEAAHRTGLQLCSVFVPTTPNPTSGFLTMVPQDKVVQMDMSVADGIKYIMSLGAVAPAFDPNGRHLEDHDEDSEYILEGDEEDEQEDKS